MEKITEKTGSSVFEQNILLENTEKKKITKNLLSNLGILISVFLSFAGVAVVTGDIRLSSFEDIASLGLDFFLWFFISSSAYITCSDSGMRAGLATESYNKALLSFERAKEKIIERKLQGRLSEFCRRYIDRELEDSRTAILADVGISYDQYLAKYIGEDPVSLKNDKSLSSARCEAIIKANAIAPIKLTPNMIMSHGHGTLRRSPLGTHPDTVKYFRIGTKLITSFFLSLILSIIVIDTVKEPSWAVVAACFIKLVTVAINSFSGYKFGYENVVIDSVNYMSEQVDIMELVSEEMENPCVKNA